MINLTEINKITDEIELNNLVRSYIIMVIFLVNSHLNYHGLIIILYESQH